MRHLQERGPVQVTLERGMIRLRRGNPQAEGLYDTDTTNALRAFFQAERDDALGRWRDPKNPDYVVYPRPDLDDDDGRGVLVLNERSAATRHDWEQIALPGPADRYFTAHPLPEPEPKPWENAKEGDYWVLTIGGEPSLWHKGTRRLFWTDGERLSGTDLKDATAGHRIWPGEDK